MIRAQRRFHAVIWPLIAIALCVLIGAALVTRQHTAAVTAAAPPARPF